MAASGGKWDTLEDKAFGFIATIPRPAKPREFGMTIVADRGIGVNQISDLMDAAGDYVDWVKIAIGAFRLHTPQFLRKKIALYKENGVRLFFAGDVSEMAAMRGQADRYYAEVAEYGAEGVEISSAQVATSIEDKVRLIRMAAARGLKPIAEAGRKGRFDKPPHSGYICAQAAAYLEAGAWRVLVQGEGIVEGVDINEGVLFDLATRFGVHNLIYQAKDTASQTWFLDNLGPEVNLDVDPDHVINLELSRRGLRKHGLFGVVSAIPEER